MKGLANSVGAATIFSLGLHPGANGQSLRQGTTDSGRSARAAETGLRMEEITGANSWRGLQSADHMADGETDDALDVNGTVSDPCLLYTSPSPRDGLLSRMPSSA